MPVFSIFDFKRAVAKQFADRPTLRQVASEQILSLLLKHIPGLANVKPALLNADPLSLDSPESGTKQWTTAPLVDVVLQALLEGKALDLEAVEGHDHHLGLHADYRFAGSQTEFTGQRLTGATEAFNELIQQLPGYLRQAQLDFWRAEGSSGKSRDHWMQLLLRTALLRNLPLQGLDDQQAACIRSLIKGGAMQPSVFAVQAQLSVDEQLFEELQLGLLVSCEWDERQVVLWCSPSSVIQAFDSLEGFALGLRDELVLRYDFDAMSWDRYELEGNVFSQQCAMLLDHMLVRIEQVRHLPLSGVAEMERVFAELTDPAQWFFAGYFVDETSAVLLPPGIQESSANDSFAIQAALLGLALVQADSDGKSSLDGVQDLHSFTRQRLRQQMLSDYPVEANYFSDDLILELKVAMGVPGGAGTGAGGGEPLVSVGEKTLTEFAIGNLSSLNGAAVSSIRHRDEQLIMPWMNADYIKTLVETVDIGGSYPDYVAQALNDPQTRTDRTQRFAQEWRQSLMFHALTAKIDDKITEVGLQCIVDFCNGHMDQVLPGITLMPLAFKRQPESANRDKVRGMYVLFSAEPSVVLLYRPLYNNDCLRQFSSIEAMMAGIRESESLQESMLEWMDSKVRHIYENNGFTEPHVTSIGLDPYNLPESPDPVSFAAKFWQHEVDEKLYMANVELLFEIADFQTTSNAESRWAILTQGAWLLFDVVTLVLRGPVASVAWLMQSISSLQNDIEALEQGSEFERSTAAVDLILNAGMTLFHAKLPGAVLEQPTRMLGSTAFEGPPAQNGGYAAMRVLPVQGRVGTSGALSLPDRQLDFSWRGNQGFNQLTAEQRKALMAMRSSVSLNGLEALDSGLYVSGGNHYVPMLGEVFAVRALNEDIRVVDAAGQLGPWLIFEAESWRIDTKLRLSGGMPRETLQSKFSKMSAAADRLTGESLEAEKAFKALLDTVTSDQKRLVILGNLKIDESNKRTQALADNDSTFDWEASERSIISYDQKIAALKVGLKPLVLEAVGHIELVVQNDVKQYALLATMLEPKYGAAQQSRFDETLKLQRERLRSGLIHNSVYALTELRNLADYPLIDQLQQQLVGLPLAQIRDSYTAYRSELRTVVDFQERMLVLEGGLDSLLSEAPADLEIGVGERQITIAQIIDEREYSTVDLRFHQALNLADLALDQTLAPDQRQLDQFKNGLTGSTLKSAASAHGELVMANIPTADTISILQEAWDEYAAAIVNSLEFERTNKALVDASMLSRYRAHLELLKDDAGRRLIEAIKQQDNNATVSTKRSAYKVSTESPQVIRNSDGQAIIAFEVQEGENRVLEVRDPVSRNAVKKFDFIDGQWQERPDDVTGSVIAEPEVESVNARVQALLDEKNYVLTVADAYIRADLGGAKLDRLFLRLGKSMQSLAEELVAQGESDSEVARLREGMEHLQSSKTRLLTDLYSKTKYPTDQALRFLFEQGLIKVDYVRRDTAITTSPFDEFKITRLNNSGGTKGKAVWAAHFHLATQDALLVDFTYAHLKLWAQRFDGRNSEAATGTRVHRGPLTRAQVAGIIPLI